MSDEGSMTAVTLRTMVQSVAERWRRQYAPFGGQYPKSLSTYEKLSALDASVATPEEVEAIIGNRSWTRVECDGCGRNVGAAVEIERYEQSLTLCADCLTRAASLLPPSVGARASGEEPGTP